jgi:hypothetical protein
LRADRFGVRFRLVCAGSLLLVLVLGDPPDDTLFWNALFDVGHAVLFAALTWLAVGLRSGSTSILRHAAFTLSAVVAIAAGTEFLQFLDPSRNPSIGDFARDVAGAVFVLAGTRLTEMRRWQIVQRLVGIAAAVGVMIPMALVLELYLQRNRAFPVVVAFDDSRWEREFLTVGGATLIPKSASLSESNDMATLLLEPGLYPGFAMDEPYPDWQNYDRLVFTAIGDQRGPVAVTLRVHDRSHDGEFDDRFNQTIIIQRGLQEISVPLSDIRDGPVERTLDLSHVRGIALFAYQLDRSAVVQLGPFHLE